MNKLSMKLAIASILFTGQSFALEVSREEFQALMKRLTYLEKEVKNKRALEGKVERLEKRLQSLGNKVQVVDGLEERLDEVQESHEYVQDELDYIREEGALGAVQSYAGNLTFGGYFDVEFHNRKSAGKRSASKFDQHRFVLDFSARLSEKIKFLAELEYEHSADSVGMEQLLIDYETGEGQGFRMGSILIPMGKVNELHDAPLRDFNARPKMHKTIIPTTWFDTGAGYYWSGGSEDHPVDFQLYVMNGLQDDGYKLAAGTGIRSLRKKGKDGLEKTHNKALTGRVGYQVSDRVKTGLSFYQTDVGAYTPAPAGGNPALFGERDLEMWAFDYETDLSDRWHLTGEYARGFVSSNVAPGAAAPTASTPGGSSYGLQGWFSQLAYDLDEQKQWRAVVRVGETDTSIGYTNAGDVDEKVVGVNYRPNESTVYKLEYHFEDQLNNLGISQSNDGFVFGVASYF